MSKQLPISDATASSLDGSAAGLLTARTPCIVLEIPMFLPLPRFLPLSVLLSLAGCGQAPSSAAPSAPEENTTAIASSGDPGRLRMHVDGVEWSADREFFGAVHPPGMDRAVLIAGSLGPKDENEQTFNLSLFGVDGPGRYVVERGDGSGSVMQLANLTPERYLIGGLMFDYRFEVELLEMQVDPVVIVARFSGELQSNDDQRVTISDGEFVYRE
jgi:hypothetical protein